MTLPIIIKHVVQNTHYSFTVFINCYGSLVQWLHQRIFYEFIMSFIQNLNLKSKGTCEIKSTIFAFEM